jgi:hypothetical protein
MKCFTVVSILSDQVFSSNGTMLLILTPAVSRRISGNNELIAQNGQFVRTRIEFRPTPLLMVLGASTSTPAISISEIQRRVMA